MVAEVVRFVVTEGLAEGFGVAELAEDVLATDEVAAVAGAAEARALSSRAFAARSTAEVPGAGRSALRTENERSGYWRS